jgi:hypothetical protein
MRIVYEMISIKIRANTVCWLNISLVLVLEHQ